MGDAVAGVVVGVVGGLLIRFALPLLSQGTRLPGSNKVSSLSSRSFPLSRQERMEQLSPETMPPSLLAGPSTLSLSSATAPATTVAGVEDGATGSTSETDSSSYETEEESDAEYNRMEALRLKVVFVVRHPMEPKLLAQDMAVLTASAGVELVELIQKRIRSLPSGLESTTAEEDLRQWREWYLWWNRIGCGKITLRCPEQSAFNALVEAAVQRGLPVVQISRGGKVVPGCSREDATRGGETAVIAAIGPAPSDVLEPISGKLKLLT